MSDAIERGKIFVWGQFGQELKEKDPERLWAIAQQNPEYFLAVISNAEIETIIKDILDSGELTKETMELIMTSNKLDDIFRQISIFMKESPDMLSIGSFLTGETEEKKAFLVTPKAKLEGDEI